MEIPSDVMKYHQFWHLPRELQVQIIRKCCPIPYVRCRQTCRFMDEFCERNNSSLGIFCHYKEGILSLERRKKKGSKEEGYYICIKTRRQRYSAKAARENIDEVRQSLSGFTFECVHLTGNGEESLEPLKCFLEAVPNLKVVDLQLYRLPAEQVELVAKNIFKVGREITIKSGGEMHKILKIGAIKKLDTTLIWSNKDLEPGQELVEFARGKNQLLFHTNRLNSISALNILKAIVKNWKKDGRYPECFYIQWQRKNANYYDRTFSPGLHGKLMGMEAEYFGCFENPKSKKYYGKKSDVWIRKEGEEEHAVIITRIQSDTKTIVKFITFATKDDFAWLMARVLLGLCHDFFYTDERFPRIRSDRLMEKLETLCEKLQDMDNLEKIREKFSKAVHNIIEKMKVMKSDEEDEDRGGGDESEDEEHEEE